MHANMNMPANAANKPSPNLPIGIRLAGIAVRTLFLIVLTVMTVRVAAPQVENIWSVLETPSDFIRVVVGFALCAWFVINLFILPRDPEAFRIWMYLGPVILPLSGLCVVVGW
jgi:hypothetical protein